jgi:single-stranded-DNA-specific exonuclease
MASATGLQRPTCRALAARGVNTAEDVQTFLDPELHRLHDPFLMKDMDKAVDRLKEAIRSRDRILIYGDYDADGICATALLMRYLDELGATLSYYVPDRISEGYGLNRDRLRWAQEMETKLIICVDNGISSQDEIAFAREMGIDVIVTDHHEPPEGELPSAAAVLDPKRRDSAYPFRELSGVGVALKLYQGLTGETKGLDLVALGTIADVVPLLGENRTLVRSGLEEINARRRTGVEQLIAVSGLGQKDLNAYNVAFQLAPRINAAGRIGSAHTGVQLLLTNSVQTAAEIARTLDGENQKRRDIEKQIIEQANAILSETFVSSQRAIVLADPRWHSGVIGIAASRLVDKYYRPTALIGLTDDVGKGSARSIEGFDLHAALQSCGDLLETFGGHRLAAGFTVKAGRVDELRDRLNRLAAERIPEEKLVPELAIDAVVGLDEIDGVLVEQFERFRPFGAGNRRPVLACKRVQPVGTVEVLKGAHVKFRVRQNEAWRAVIGFGMADRYDEIAGRKTIDIAVTPRINRWRDRKELQLILKDVKLES